MDADLTRERGLWGPPCSSQLDKWALDMVEGINNIFISNECIIYSILCCPDARRGYSWQGSRYLPAMRALLSVR